VTLAPVRPRNRGIYAAIAFLIAVSIALQVERDRGWEPYQPPNPVLWLPSGTLVKRLALGFGNLVADVYWMRAVVYYGSKRLEQGTARNFDLLYPLLEVVTTVDPKFKVAYRFGSIFLTEGYPNGPGRPDQAIALLQRGIERDDSRWEYMQDIGFVYYWWLRDYDAAARWFERASEQKDAPSWMKPLAATTLARGGNRNSSRFLWRQILDTTDVDWLRQNALRRLSQLDAMDVIDKLNELVAGFKARTGRPPSSWQDLMSGTGLQGVPLDPSGSPYDLDPVTGQILLSRSSELFPLPTDTPNPAPPQ
jgi:tetratricopeptide (TPR) repeat protein